MQTEDRIQITSEPIDVAAMIAWVSSPQSGGIAIFLGCTRGETHADGRQLVALDYEAYEQMAEPQLHNMVAQARKRWPIIRAAVSHRTGQVLVSEPSVAIVVGTPHRADAFEACRFLIDELKKSAAIWKKEIWNEGDASWVKGVLPETK